MQGFAKELFQKKTGRSLALQGLKDSQRHRWPYIGALVMQGKMDYIDVALAERLLCDCSDIEQSDIAFLCYLSLISRRGHLCVVFDGDEFIPSPRQVWNEREDSSALSEEEFSKLYELIVAGFKKLPEELISDVGDAERLPYRPLCRCFHGTWQLLYLQRNWLLESLVLKNVDRITSVPVKLSVDMEKVRDAVEVLQEKGKLLPEQAQAIVTACQQNFTMIIGGPGTGKSYTAGMLIKVLWEAMTPMQQRYCEIALAAPTGKAVSTLHASLVHDQLSLSAQTLHALLGVKKSGMPKGEKLSFLSADILIVDESSMIDARMMVLLLSAVKNGARLIMLGDQHQLPPVEVGSLFADLVNQAEENRPSVVMLEKCMRVEHHAILEVARAIHSGNAETTLSILSNPGEGVVWRTFERSLEEIQKCLLDEVQHCFPSCAVGACDPVSILQEANSFRMLSPLRKGPLGVDTLNRLLMKRLLRKTHPEQWSVVPIIVVANDYRLKLFNGETGVLVRRSGIVSDTNFQFQPGDYALFPGPTMRRLPALLLPRVEPAYCLSVHKSQGSEFDHVLLLVPEGSCAFGREVLYTGVTRAKRKLEIWGKRQTLEATIISSSRRLSGIAYQQTIGKIVVGNA